MKGAQLLIHRETRLASRRARALVESEDDCEVVGVTCRAEETDRWVFAVFFKKLWPQRPTPYKLIAVDRVVRGGFLSDCRIQVIEIVDRLTPTELCKTLAATFSEIAGVLEEHLADNDELLAHVFLGDVTRYVLSGGPQRRGVVQYLEDSFALGGDVEELIAISFVENLETLEQLEQAVEGIRAERIRSEWDRQHRGQS